MEVRAAMVVVIGMPETTALERIWICTLCVQSPCSSNEKMQAFSRFPRFAAFIDHGFGAVLGGVHDPLDFLVVNEVQQVRAATGDAEHGAGLDAFVVEHRRGAAGGVQFVSEVHELANERDSLLLGFVLERDDNANIFL